MCCGKLEEGGIIYLGWGRGEIWDFDVFRIKGRVGWVLKSDG